MVYKVLCAHIDWDVPIYGLQARGIENDLIAHQSIVEMAQSYVEAIRTLQPRGPYRLLGWSLGGMVAQEMARQIEASDDEVEVLFALDTRFDRIGREVQAQSEENILHDFADRWGIPVSGKTTSAIKEALAEFAFVNGILPQGGDPLILDRMLLAMLQAQRLVSEHRVGRVKAPIVYFRADDNDCPDVTGMLAGTTTGLFVEVAVDARHSSLCDPEPAAVIGAEVNRYLLKVGTVGKAEQTPSL